MRARRAALLVAVLAAGCGERAPLVPQRPLRVALSAAPVGLDPHFANDFHTYAVLANVYEGLTLLDGELRVAPGLAQSWENPDDLTWVFHLRPGARFHDGRPLAPADVVYSLERARDDARTDVASYLVGVERVRARGPASVELSTARPGATLLRRLAFVAIVPAGSAEPIEESLGTGPYRLAGGAGGLALEAFPEYWGGAPAISRVELEVVPAGRERADRLLGGELDVAPELAARDAERLRAAPGRRLAAVDGVQVAHLEMRVDRPPFDDPRVRRAVDLALDRRALVEELFLGHGRPMGQLVTGNVVGYAPDLAPPARDLERARALLAEAGHAGGFDVDLEYSTGREVGGIQRQLGEAGIRARAVERPWNELYRRMLAGEVTFQLGTLVAESGDAADILDPVLHSGGTVAGYGEANSSAYSNPELDALIERAGVTLDTLERRQLLQRCLRLAMADLPHVPLYAPAALYGLDERLRWQPRLDGLVLASEFAWER